MRFEGRTLIVAISLLLCHFYYLHKIPASKILPQLTSFIWIRSIFLGSIFASSSEITEPELLQTKNWPNFINLFHFENKYELSMSFIVWRESRITFRAKQTKEAHSKVLLEVQNPFYLIRQLQHQAFKWMVLLVLSLANKSTKYYS